MEKNYFHSEPNEKEAYSIVIPPPNVTAALHLGHALNNTLQDVLIRFRRMQQRATLWMQDLVQALEDLDHAERSIRFRGVKGTTGTQASFLELFEGDHDKVRALDQRVAEKMGFEKRFAVTGQTYPRQLDFRVGQALSSIAQTAHKFATDLRLLSNRKEIEGPAPNPGA